MYTEDENECLSLMFAMGGQTLKHDRIFKVRMFVKQRLLVWQGHRGLNSNNSQINKHKKQLI